MRGDGRRPKGLALRVSASVAALGLSACASQVSFSGQESRATANSRTAALQVPQFERSGRIRKGGGTYKIGTPYRMMGRWYTPREQPDYDRIGIASWYGDGFHNRPTANGEVYDMDALSAAHPTLPLPSYAWVTNLDNDRTVLVRINDRGPYIGDRMIDLSRAASKALAFEERGLARVRVRYAGRAPLDGDDAREWRHLRSQTWMVEREFSRPPSPRASLKLPVVATAMARLGVPPPVPLPPTTVERIATGSVNSPKSEELPQSMQALGQSLTRPIEPEPDRPPTPAERAEASVLAPAVVVAGSYRTRTDAEHRVLALAPVISLSVELSADPAAGLFSVRTEPMAGAAARALTKQLNAFGVRGLAVVSVTMQP